MEILKSLFQVAQPINDGVMIPTQGIRFWDQHLLRVTESVQRQENTKCHTNADVNGIVLFSWKKWIQDGNSRDIYVGFV